MSQTPSAAYAREGHAESKHHDVAHIWMPTRRSLCDLAGQVLLSEDAAAAHNKHAEALPACGACLIIADTLSRSAKAAASSRGAIEPATAATAVDQLRTTHWQWALTPDAFDRLQDADYPGKEK